MPVTSLVADPNKTQSWNGEQKLFGFGPYQLVVVWKLEMLQITAGLQLRQIGVADEAPMQQPSPLHGKASVHLEGTWDNVGKTTVDLSFNTDDLKLTMKGTLTYFRDFNGAGPEITVSIDEVINLG